ncbi:esterase/lipase family protein [Actinophytocola glycyrrhizae]|uniref:Esterase/lipase family protein n=1 Tax=Actinophytocola glycyrrhizae TaxID=2044873 RepID=A0ABV9SF31_9PSEU
MKPPAGGPSAFASVSRTVGGALFVAGLVSGTRKQSAPRDTGLGVLLVPGFGCGDWSLLPAAAWLRHRGHRPAAARIGLNVGCTTELVARIERRAEEHAEATGDPVVLVGQSRGGWLSRLVAVRRPDLVRALVTAGSPVLDPLGVNPKVMRNARFLTRLSAFGLPGLLDDDCFTGECFRDNMSALRGPLPDGMPALAVYSRLDRVVPWQLCQDRSAECVEVRSGHTGMLLQPEFYSALAPRLSRWARSRRESSAPEWRCCHAAPG